MSGLKIHLEPGERHVVNRLARAIKVTPEDVAYAALDRLMNEAMDPEVQQSIKECSLGRRDNLPLWADSERSVHAYEGAPDDQPEERLQF
ncbi:hypothetical protein [Synoicihabitans lomoniglobus]|uniref:Uncharacterized protein n=1 Tax=Synoicihabitans lomoniglobus TaxID=2909285 RepID=A0AAE9ZR90_9BACT|nr:hypothetical protein [Opitutaceae bacterium LMO-M01]WED63765.1 hypothetical protein PXH66_15620 [Opitutaceae bacterium LMO-M01]